MTIARTIRGIRDNIPQGYLLGRKSAGSGPVELLALKDLSEMGVGGSGSGAAIQAYLAYGTHANRPANPGVPVGATAFYYETDTSGLYVWTGAAWVVVGGGGSSDGENNTPTNPGWDPASAQGLNGSTFYSIPLTSLNTVATTPASAVQSLLWCTPGRLSGKRYFEMSLTNGSNSGAIGLIWGIGRSNFRPGILGQDIGQVGWSSGGGVQARYDFSPFGGAYTVATVQGWVSGNTLCCAVDLDARLIWFRTNGGNWNNSGTADPATGAGGIDLNRAYQRISAPIKLYPAANANSTSSDISTVNLIGSFAETVPAGFVNWSN